MIDTLKRLVPTTEREIDRHYYYCYGEGNVQVEQTGSVVVYIVRGERVDNYLNSRYGQHANRGHGDLRFRKVDIFDAKWTSKFGYPAVINRRGNNNDFSGSFSCLGGNSIKGHGTITNIGSDYIEARDAKGRSHKYTIGACSRLESTNEYPKIGQ